MTSENAQSSMPPMSMKELSEKLKFNFFEADDGQSLYDYFTKDYKQEIQEARQEAEEELFIPLPDDQDG